MTIPYTLIRSKRRSLALQVSKEGTLIARAPIRMSAHIIEKFIEQKRDWIEKNQKKIESKGPRKIYTEVEIRLLKESLKEYIIPRVSEIWEGKNLPKFTSIKITKSERRWGSCSSKNGLCFSYRLAEYLQQTHTQTQMNQNMTLRKYDTNVSVSSVCVYSPFIDAIIIHELAHLREKNHQKPFWNLVYSMMPEYEEVMRRTQNTSAY